MVLLNTQCVLTTLRNEILRQLKSSSKFLDSTSKRPDNNALSRKDLNQGVFD